MLFHCNSRISLYPATVITSSQLNAADHGGGLQGAEGTFHPKRSKLPNYFQQCDTPFTKLGKLKDLF